VGSPGISFGKCYIFRIYLFVSGVLLCFVLCCVWNAIFICVSLKSFVIFLVSLPLYVKVANKNCK
jgi:hypothetical protein